MIYGNRQTLQEKSTVYKNMMHLNDNVKLKRYDMENHYSWLL